MNKYLVLTTGGTIASIHTENGLKPHITSQELLEYIPDIKSQCQLDAVEICNIDSTNMSLEIWQRLVLMIKEKYDQYDGFLILHGTDTLAYSAAALSYMIRDSKKPIVLTGSQRPISFDSTDAIENLHDSFYYMMSPKSSGVRVVFGGKVIAGTRAKKVNSLSYRAFDSINYPVMAAVRNKQVIHYIHEEIQNKQPTFTTWMDKNVFVLKLTPNTNERVIRNLYDYNDGIIIEGFGVGGVPQRIFDTLLDCQNKHPQTLLVLTTQVLSEGSHVSVYEVGKQLEGKCHYLEARDMNLEAVIAKVMWILGKNLKEFSEQEALFYQTINFDMLGQ